MHKMKYLIDRQFHHFAVKFQIKFTNFLIEVLPVEAVTSASES